jgi:hypothetical protein
MAISAYYFIRPLLYVPLVVSSSDIGGIDDQHCLSFLFITNINKANNPSALQV